LNFYKPLHLIFGEYIFETEKAVFPRLANVLSDKRIHFWGGELKEDRVRIHCSVFAAEELSFTAKEINAPIGLVAKKGIPFFMAGFRKRYGLFVGMLLGMLLLFYSQMFVWKIEISGNTNVTDQEIEQALAQCGIYEGSFIPYIDVLKDANILLMNCRSISSAAISIRGNHLYLSVLERTPLPDIVDTEGYYNVVAECDGIIMDMDAAAGTPEVNEGDVVYKGELLINSFVARTNGTFSPTHARGIVYAQVKKEFRSEVPFNRTTKAYTGKTDTKKKYYLLGKELNFWTKEQSEYEYFDAVSAEYDVKLFGFIELPIRVFRVTYSEYEPLNTIITADFAEELARDELDTYLKGLNSEVLSCESEVFVDEKNSVCILTANAVVKQNIAKEVAFNIGDQNISERLPNARE